METSCLNIYKIYETDEELLIHNLKNLQIIAIHKVYKDISAKSIECLSKINFENIVNAKGILGIVELQNLEFLLYIKQDNKLGQIGNTDIFEISEVDFINLNSNNNESFNNDIAIMIKGYKELFKQGFYYSHNYDLTNSLQRQKQIKIKNNNTYNILTDANADYMWNRSLINKFIEYNLYNNFIVNCICGYIGFLDKIIKQSKLSIVLLSRRNTKNAGISAYKSSVLNGNVSNYVETEQIVIINKNIFSCVQIRGNLPVSYQPNFNVEEIKSNFKQHLSELNSEYKFIFCINLMNSNRINEQFITNQFEKYIKDSDLQFLKYSFFNLEDCAENAKEEIDKMILSLKNLFEMFRFFGLYYSSDNSNDKIMCDQIGLIRSNCYNSIERTNIFQNNIGWALLSLVLNKININLEEHLYQDDISNANANRISDVADLLFNENNNDNNTNHFKLRDDYDELWKQNNSKLSLQYIGVGNTNYEINLIPDQLKQYLIDLLLKEQSSLSSSKIN